MTYKLLHKPEHGEGNYYLQGSRFYERNKTNEFKMLLKLRNKKIVLDLVHYKFIQINEVYCICRLNEVCYDILGVCLIYAVFTAGTFFGNTNG